MASPRKSQFLSVTYYLSANYGDADLTKKSWHHIKLAGACL
jgi:hypothetical protein